MKHIITKLFEESESDERYVNEFRYIPEYQYFMKYAHEQETYEDIMQFESVGLKYELYKLEIRNTQTAKYYEYCIIIWGGQRVLGELQLSSVEDRFFCHGNVELRAGFSNLHEDTKEYKKIDNEWFKDWVTVGKDAGKFKI